jgi:hypothetical protein
MEISTFTNKKNEIIKYIFESKKPNQTKKTVLSALYGVSNEVDYRTLMLEICKKVNETYKGQTMSQKQKENSFEEIQEKVKDLMTILSKSKSVENYQNFLILAFMSGVYFEPRRNEIGTIKIRNYDVKTDNYLKKDVLVFNSYKTVAKYKTQTVQIPKPLMKIVRQWLKVNDTDYLFYSEKTRKGFSSASLGKRLYKIFDGKRIGCDALKKHK